MDQIEVVRAAVFSLEQAAQRIDTLAAGARAPALTDHLRGIARLLRERAGELNTRHGR